MNSLVNVKVRMLAATPARPNTDSLFRPSLSDKCPVKGCSIAQENVKADKTTATCSRLICSPERRSGRNDQTRRAQAFLTNYFRRTE